MTHFKAILSLKGPAALENDRKPPLLIQSRWVHVEKKEAMKEKAVQETHVSFLVWAHPNQIVLIARFLKGQ